MIERLEQLLSARGLSDTWADYLAPALLVVGVLLLAWVADVVTRRLLLRGVHRLVQRSEAQWDDILLEEGLFKRLAHFAPAIVIYSFGQAFGSAEPWIEKLALVYMIAVSVLLFQALLDGGLRIYQSQDVSREKPIQGWIQLGGLIGYLIGGIFAVSVVLEREPWGLLTGLGAMSAVLLLVFRDSILGFVASVQLATNDMLRRGDWLEMPSHQADGDVIEVGLHTVKVQNWDKTITTIPTQELITSPFKNWRGMAESGGRRIKRAIHIDIGTIRLCDDEMLERFGRFELIAEYIAAKRAEIADSAHDGAGDGPEVLINQRRLTNVGTFRAYIEAYLRQNAHIHQSMTFLVRQLPPGAQGLPIEIYVFSNDQDWVRYEAIQADIFDHLLAVAPLFDLRIFQAPGVHAILEASSQIAAHPPGSA
jgi:miniconductance mechanosensitive channel